MCMHITRQRLHLDLRSLQNTNRKSQMQHRRAPPVTGSDRNRVVVFSLISALDISSKTLRLLPAFRQHISRNYAISGTNNFALNDTDQVYSHRRLSSEGEIPYTDCLVLYCNSRASLKLLTASLKFFS